MRTSKTANSILAGASDSPPTAPIIVIEEQTPRPSAATHRVSAAVTSDELGAFESSCVYLAENEIEAKKLSNNMTVSEDHSGKTSTVKFSYFLYRSK